MFDNSLDIIGQSPWDLWVLVCVAACLVLLSYALVGRLWASTKGMAVLLVILGAVAGTALILAVPRLHTPLVAMIWTFLVLVILSGVFYENLVPQLGRLRTGVLVVIRVAALAGLVLMLFMPGCRYVSRPAPERPLLLVVDASGSMSFPDVQNGPTRIQSVWQTLRPLLPRLKEHFVPQYFTFATELKQLERPEDLAQLTADGKATDIAGALARVMGRVTRPDAAILLVSDGIDNTSPDVIEAARKLHFPIHTVAVGSDQSEPAAMANVAIDNVEGADDFIVNHETLITVTVKSTALDNRVVDVQLAETGPDGKPAGEITKQKLVLEPKVEGQKPKLPYKPKTVGVHKLAVWIDPVAGERSTADNRQDFQGLALDPRIKVLYIEGRVRPEYTQLKRALERDPNIELATLLRIQENRFTGGGTVDAIAFAAMPSSAEQWQKFDVIIIGDLDASHLAPVNQIAIEQRVSEGGGVLMIGGQKTFGAGRYKETPLEKALPVSCGDVTAAQETSEFVPRLTVDGAAHPAMEGLLEWFGAADKKPEKTLPPLRGNVVVPRPKAGAQVLLVHADRPGPDGQPQIVLATQRYGKGRAAACTVDTTYLWYLPLRGMGQDSPYNRFWGQLVRWLAGEDVRNRQRGAGIEGLLNKSVYDLGQGVHVRAMVRDDKGDATRFAEVKLVLWRAGETAQSQLALPASEARTGMYEATIPHPEKGEYTIELIASKDGKELGRQSLKFTVIPPADEMLKIAANPMLLNNLAASTKGYSYRLEQLPTLIEQLVKSDLAAKNAEEVWLPLYNWPRLVASAVMKKPPRWRHELDLPMQGAITFALLAVEWLLRRQWRLP